MLRSIVIAAAATTLLATPSLAHEGMAGMPGMETPKAPGPKKPARPHKPAAVKKPAGLTAPVPAPVIAPPAPTIAPETPPASAPTEMQSMDGMDMSGAADNSAHDHGAISNEMTGVFGAYGMTRDASGTSWQPDSAPHEGLHFMLGDWMLMGHLTLNGVYDWQGGPRGDEKSFVAGMIMGAARRDFDDGGVLNLRAMLAPDPFMGKSGYPLLLQAGETADGSTTLRDRQHPHDLFMELSASYAHPLSDKDSLFIYGGLPGEPAFGPPAFMHRLTAMDSPAAPISHHWFDSTHVTFGVVTLGWVHDDWKIEASSFRGREPDEKRYNIESPRLNSESVRVSWNPTERLSLQASWADLNSPEALHPDEDETRWSASAMYVFPLGHEGYWSAFAAFGRKEHGGENLDAWTVETAWKPNPQWTVFGRFENLDNADLAVAPATDTPQNVSKLSAGLVRDFQIRDHVSFGVGGEISRSFVSNALSASYDGDQNGAMAFVRLKVN